MNKRIRDILRRGQRGFTLIELVAVMAILAILVAIVAPAAINSERASITAQAQADSPSVRNAATDFFTRHNESEVRTPHTVTLVTAVNDFENKAPMTLSGTDGLVLQQQVVSSRWPEIYITEGTPVPGLARTANSRYSDVFPTTGQARPVVNVNLLDKDGREISGNELLGQYTAIDLQKLVSEDLLNKMPDGVGKTSDTGVTVNGTELRAPNFLWLFKKQSSSLGTDDDRVVTVFTLVKVGQVEKAGGAEFVQLTYQQILGPGPDPAVFATPLIDGVLSSNEWGTPAFSYRSTNAYTGPVNIYVTNDASNLYIAAQADPSHSSWSTAANLGLAAGLNISIVPLGDGERGVKNNYDDTYFTLIASDNEYYLAEAGPLAFDTGTPGRKIGANGAGIVEVSIPLSLLGMHPGERMVIMFQAFGYTRFPSYTGAERTLAGS